VNALAGEFPAFAHWHEGGAKPERDHGAQEKAPSIEPDDNVDLLVGRGWYGSGHEAMCQVGDHGLNG